MVKIFDKEIGEYFKPIWIWLGTLVKIFQLAIR